MPPRPLPPDVAALLAALNAPPRLVRHLTLVHDVALTLVDAITKRRPSFQFDHGAVLIGAAIHDAGKVLHPGELTGPGARHEDDGPAFLTSHGLPETHARFARTHARWAADPDATTEEDLLVALADHLWKGKRHDALETRLAQRIASATGEETWRVYAALDDLATAIARDAGARITWQTAGGTSMSDAR
jgi:hypothetical protein